MKEMERWWVTFCAVALTLLLGWIAAGAVVREADEGSIASLVNLLPMCPESIRGSHLEIEGKGENNHCTINDLG